MKKKTIARIVRMVVILAVAIAAMAPVIDAFGNMGSTPMEDRVHAVYDLDLMDRDTLSSNIMRAVSGTEGCTAEYGDAEVPIVDGRYGEIAEAALLSGADTMVLRGPDGSVLLQSSIEYGNDVMTGGRLGFTVRGLLGDAVSLKLGIRLVSSDGAVDIPYLCTSYSVDDEIGMDYMIPHVALNIAAAYGCMTDVSIGVEYERMASAGASMTESGYTCPSSVRMDGGTMELRIENCYGASNGTGTLGDAQVEVSGGTMTIRSEGLLSEVLASSLSDGRLTTTFGGSSFEMDRDMASALMDAVKALEAGA